MKVELPGIVWVLLIIVATALVHEYEAYLPGDPIYWDMAIVALMGWLKSLSLNNDVMTQAFQALDVFRTHIAKRQVRSTESIERATVEPLPVVEVPEMPSKMNRILWG